MTDYTGFVEIFDYYPTSLTADGGMNTVWLGANGALVSGIRGHGKSWVQPNGEGMKRLVPVTNLLSLLVTVKLGSFRTGALFSIRNLAGDPICYVGTDAVGRVYIGNSATAAGIFLLSTVPLVPNSIENISITLDISTFISNSASISVRGNPADTATGVHLTVGTTPSQIGLVYLQNYIEATSFYDAWVVETDVIELIPEVEGFYIPPNSDSSVAFTRLSGASNFAMVNEASSDGDTTYNSGNTVGNKDLFGFPNLTGIPESIFTVSVMTCARKEESGTRQFKNKFKLSTEHDGIDSALSQTYNWFQTNYRKNPETATPWAKTALDGIVKAGYEAVL